ncbi:MAG TPA: MaoC family dehydratase [Candidatus Dormibacteraeota bacterium]
MDKRYLEDFHAGQSFDLGESQVTQEEIIEFARRFDPQRFHVDPEAARESVFGGLIASGWHTASLWMRGFTEVVLNQSHSLGSPGVEELRWLRPVRPGDRLRGRYTVLEVTPSSSNPGRGTLRAEGDFVNQEGEVVMRLTARNHFVRRSRDAPE